MEISRISNSSEMTSMNIVSSKSEETSKAEPTSKEASASGNDEGKVQAVDMKNKYDAISKDGDTLEISESNDKDNNSDRIKISESSIKSVKPQVSDAVLSKMSKAKLQQMLASGKITRQQYNKAIKS